MTNKQNPRLAFVAAETDEAIAAKAALENRYGTIALDEADVIVALGGDGVMLHTLHQFMDNGTPIFGMQQGSIGFLMNHFEEENLPTRINNAKMSHLHPLEMKARDAAGKTHTALAINEVSLLRQTAQAAKLAISVDDKPRLQELICDGVLLATPAGSTAYNLSAHGAILPIDASLLALTPISAFRPRRWRGALLSETAIVNIKTLEADKRPVSAVADHSEVRDIVEVTIRQDKSRVLRMLFDSDHSLEERVLAEQFAP
ncbi:MAG: NAD kinase [Alphaproteobacteria bacterium]|nr:NAD kinase [Alphaproteobacteria bacterium]